MPTNTAQAILRPSGTRQQSKPHQSPRREPSEIESLTTEYAKLQTAGGPASFEARVRLGAKIHDALKAMGGEWSDGTAIWILTTDAERMVANLGDSAKWTTIARFDSGGSSRSIQASAGDLRRHRKALAGKVVAS
jgi:hypothetical protein